MALYTITENNLKNIREAAKKLPFKVSIARQNSTKRTNGSVSIRPVGGKPWSQEQAATVYEKLVKPMNLNSDYGLNTEIISSYISGFFYLFQQK